MGQCTAGGMLVPVSIFSFHCIISCNVKLLSAVFVSATLFGIGNLYSRRTVPRKLCMAALYFLFVSAMVRTMQRMSMGLRFTEV